jgi:hypothetical protein
VLFASKYVSDSIDSIPTISRRALCGGKKGMPNSQTGLSIPPKFSVPLKRFLVAYALGIQQGRFGSKVQPLRGVIFMPQIFGLDM